MPVLLEKGGLHRHGGDRPARRHEQDWSSASVRVAKNDPVELQSGEARGERNVAEAMEAKRRRLYGSDRQLPQPPAHNGGRASIYAVGYAAIG